ncbi:P2Y purinoceptor 3 [Hypomesus transpacificus]|uniref:P2Y purinoceptor 3 n=1 Tax=Hypomesus transpacificus TaxID=137520 RepID=UPI001F07DFEE|nr:P2Y purinoceptor 3 [Hypomesus transpacificus]
MTEEHDSLRKKGKHPPSMTISQATPLGPAGPGNPNYTSPYPPSSPTSCSIDESYKYVFLPVCYSLTFLFSLTLNSVVLLRSCRRRGDCQRGNGGSRRWNTSLIYMVNLATTDLMYGLSLPFLVASYMMKDNWVFGDFMCRLVRFLFYFNLYCSIFFLTCISVHRYLGICHPMRTITLESKRAVKGTCALVWIMVFILTCPIFRFAQTGLVVRGGGWEAGGGTPGRGENRSGFKEEGGGGGGGEGLNKAYVNCWDDAVDKDFADYVPYGITLHLLGFFVPFVIIAWCYSRVVRTIFRTLSSAPGSREGREEGGGDGGAGGGDVEGARERTSVSISSSQHFHYIRRRRKSIKTIMTITFLFALCFLPFHVTRTLFLLLRRGQVGGCNTMKMISICYKVTRPLAACNAWLNALLYFLTGDQGGPCCWPADCTNRHHRSATLWPLRILKREGVGEEEVVEVEEEEKKKERQVHAESESKSSRIMF